MKKKFRLRQTSSVEEDPILLDDEQSNSHFGSFPPISGFSVPADFNISSHLNDYSEIEHSLPATPKDLCMSIIIPSFNRLKYLKRNLTSIEEQNYDLSLIEVIVQDEGSTDGTKDFLDSYLVRKHGFTFRFFDSGKEFNRAGTRNQAISHVLSDIIVSVDVDMLLAPNLLYEVARWYSIAENFALVIERQRLNCDRLLLKDIKTWDKIEGKLKKDGDGAIIKWRKTRYKETNYLKNDVLAYECFGVGIAAFTKKQFDNIGGFSEDFMGWGGEDIEFGYRLWNSGNYIIPLLSTYAVHQEHPVNLFEKQKEGRESLEILQAKIKNIPIQKKEKIIYSNKNDVSVIDRKSVV